ncbi:MAG TPA: pyruvate kinase [Nitrosospira sp.]|nr:pyruvate kinase [Nitrosospira sp.]
MGLSKSQLPWHRTKIVCTLGPSTDAPNVVERLIANGMDVARVNTSHGNHAEHAQRIRRVRQAAQEAGQPVAILLDLPGPKFRIGNVPNGSLKLVEKTTVALGANDELEGDSSSKDWSYLPIRNPELIQAVVPGERIFLADGLIELLVQAVVSGSVECKVLIGGVVRSGSGINLPESTLDALVPTEEDRRHLAFAVAQEAEWVGVSFVQTAADIMRVRALLPDGARTLLMAKVEKRKALQNLDQIVEAADGVMVARGDLGIETDLAQIPIVQKRIIAVANAKARPVITATQMLESMVEHEHPTRAEVTDVANAVLDGTDAVMLSAETAIGRFPALSAGMLDRILAATEASGIAQGMGEIDSRWVAPWAAGSAPVGAAPSEPGNRLCNVRSNADSYTWAHTLSGAACRLGAGLGAKAIIAQVCTVAEAMNIARFRPSIPTVMTTESLHLYRSLALVRGIAPQLAPASSDERVTAIARAREWLFAHQLAKPGDAAVLLYASANGEADSLQVIWL